MLASLTLLAIVVLCSETASAADADPTPACIAWHVQAQKDRRAGKLTAAREQVLRCAQEACPSLVRGDCGRWLDEIDAELPTVLLEVIGPGGVRVVDVDVYVDGRRLAPGLGSGMAVPIDPGEHELRFVARDGRSKTERVLLLQAEKRRRISVDMSGGQAPSLQTGPAVRPDPQVEPSGPHVSWPFYPLAALGAVATGITIYFGASALSRGDELLSTCAPYCSEDDADDVQARALVADVSLAVALSSLAAAGIVLGIGLSTDPSEPARATVAVVPWPGGGTLGATMRF